jgi:hypothetical protein
MFGAGMPHSSGAKVQPTILSYIASNDDDHLKRAATAMANIPHKRVKRAESAMG